MKNCNLLIVLHIYVKYGLSDLWQNIVQGCFGKECGGYYMNLEEECNRRLE